MIRIIKKKTLDYYKRCKSQGEKEKEKRFNCEAMARARFNIGDKPLKDWAVYDRTAEAGEVRYLLINKHGDFKIFDYGIGVSTWISEREIERIEEEEKFVREHWQMGE